MRSVVTTMGFTKENIGKLCVLNAEREKAGQIIVPIGKHGNSIIYEDFGNISGTLIVGTTGSGKSSFVNTVLIEMAQKYSPEQVLFAVYDSRKVDYSFQNLNPLLLIPVIHEPSKAKILIRWLLEEARKRLNNIDHIEEYPHIFVILDDFSEMSPSNDTFSDLVKLFQIARRTKIHSWIVTSTPYNVLPTDLKANITHRIAFSVASKSISRIVLDDVGAETLNIPGEIISKVNNDIVKCEAVFLEDAVIEELSKAVAEKYHFS